MESTISKAASGTRVSVIVPTFNRANYIAECLDSLIAQTMPAFEIIVIDDGSEDGTAELLQKYGNQIRSVRKDNGGKPSAVNLGLSLVRGDLVWIFDDDDVALPNAIASRVATLQLEPDAGFVYSPHYYGTDGADGKIQIDRLHALPKHNAETFLFEIMRGCFFHLATALVRVDAYRVLGGFDSTLLRSQDYDMQIRLTHAYRATYCKEPTFIFRQHSGDRGPKAFRADGSQRVEGFRKFDQRIGQKVKCSLPLGDYLVPRKAAVLTRSEMSDALLGRMTIMCSKGCLPEMMEDLAQALTLVPSGGALASNARRTIADAVCNDYAAAMIESNWIDFRAQLDRLRGSPAGAEAVRAIALGLFRLARGYPAPISIRALRLKQAIIATIFSLKGN